MCWKYWTAWEKYKPTRLAESRSEAEKAIPPSKDYWRAWEKYLQPEQTERRSPPRRATTPSMLGWYAWERYIPSCDEVISRKPLEIASCQPVSSSDLV